MVQEQRQLFAKPLNPDLFNTIAREKATDVGLRDGRAKNENKSTQLRRFYNELVQWETRVNQATSQLEGDEVERKRKALEKFDEFLPFIRMMNAKAAYAEGRKPKLVDQSFVNLLQQTLAEVKDPETLTICKLFWEAFMGFYKQVRQD